MHLAVSNGHKAIEKLLVRAGADERAGGWTKLHLAALVQEQQGERMRAVLATTDGRAHLERRTEGASLTPLLVAGGQVQGLLYEDQCVMWSNERRYIAAACGSLEAFESLLGAGADHTAMTSAGRNLAHLCRDEDVLVAARDALGWEELKQVTTYLKGKWSTLRSVLQHLH